MNEKDPNNETIKGLLDKFLQTHYDGSFSRMACDYIHAAGMKEEEVKDLLETMKDMTKHNECSVHQSNNSFNTSSDFSTGKSGKCKR